MALNVQIPEAMRNGTITLSSVAVPQNLRGREAEAQIISSDWDDAPIWTLDFLMERSEDGGTGWMDNGATQFVSGRRTKAGNLPAIKVSTTLATTHVRFHFVMSTPKRVGWNVTIFDV